MARVRFLGLDGLRGVCALTVVLLHSELLFNAGAIFCHGYLAVDVFFLLSGFVIAASYDARLSDGLTAGRFLAARVKRLAPVFWAGTGLCVIAALARSMYDSTMSPGDVLGFGVMALLLVPVLLSGIFAYPANPVAWTLLWELVVNFLYARWLRRVGTPALGLVILVLLLLATAEAFVNPRGWSFGMTGDDLWLGGLRALPEFLIGVILHRFHCAGAFQRLPQVTPLLPLATWLVLASLPQGLSPLVDLAIVVLAAPMLVAALVRSEESASPWLVSMGALSYPLYASHLALIWLAQYTPWFGLDRGPRPFLAVGVVLLCLAVAGIMSLLFDPAGRRAFAKVPLFQANPQ